MIMKIKSATNNDLAAIEKINRMFADKVYSHSEDFFSEGIKGGRVLLACVGEQVVGYLIYQVIWGNTPFLALLRVLPEFRGQGVGSALLGALEEKLKKVGYSALISSSEKENPDGQSFHQKLGFENIGELEMIFGWEVFYKKRIRSKT